MQRRFDEVLRKKSAGTGRSHGFHRRMGFVMAAAVLVLLYTAYIGFMQPIPAGGPVIASMEVIHLETTVRDASAANPAKEVLPKDEWAGLMFWVPISNTPDVGYECHLQKGAVAVFSEEKIKSFDGLGNFLLALRADQLKPGALSGLGNVSRELEDARSAVNYHREALGILEPPGLRVATAEALVDLGYDHLKLSEPLATRNAFDRASAVGPLINLGSKLRLLDGLSRAMETLGDLTGALRYARMSIAAIESADVSFLSDAKRISYWNTSHGAYVKVAGLLTRLGKNAEAFFPISLMS